MAAVARPLEKEVIPIIKKNNWIPFLYGIELWTIEMSKIPKFAIPLPAEI
jgi:hypothetical protein